MEKTMNWKKMLALTLALALQLTVVGCNANYLPAGEISEEEVSSMTQEEIDALQAENERLQQELDELKTAQDESSEALEIVDTANSHAAAPTPITAVTFNKSTDLTLIVGDTNRRFATTTPAGGAVTYASSDTSVATVASDGTVTCKAAGNSVISATSEGVTSSYNLTVAVATGSNTSSSTASTSSTNSTGKSGALVGYTVTVDDTITPATTAAGDKWPIDKYYFYSSSGKVLGYIPGSVLEKIQETYMVQTSDGWGAPGANGDWQVWFAEQFNLYRGLSGDISSGSNSSTSNAPITVDIEAFRLEVIRLTNVEREKAGLPAVESDSIAMEFAQIRAEEITSSFSHKRPDGTTMTYGSLNFSEIIAGGQTTPSKAVTAWMNSSGHKATLLADYSNYGNRVGVGVYQAPNGSLYWVQEFVIWDADA